MRAAHWSRLAVTLALAAAPGCKSLKEYVWEPTGRPVGGEMTILRGAGAVSPSQLSPELAAAHDKYRADDVAGAEKAYHKIADNTKNPPPVAEEARFYEAECLYKQECFPKACDTYHKMLIDFPNGTYRAQSTRRMFDIANYWLDDIRQEQRAKAEGKTWVGIMPVVHFEKQKPFLDLEGRALQALEQVHLNDITGPLADKALFLAGGIKFYREDYKEADYYFTQIVEHHAQSPLAAKAVELAIIAKHMSTGGAEYDGRKVAEARQLIDIAAKAFPEVAQNRNGFLERQLAAVNLQQAQKDFNTADFYRRTNHPGAAYYYFEIVRRTYPGTPLAQQAAEKMAEIKAEFDAGKYNQVEVNTFTKLLNDWEGLFVKKGAAEATSPGRSLSDPDGAGIIPGRR